MLKLRLLALTLFCLAGMLTAAVAQDNGSAPPPSGPQGAPDHMRGRGMPDPAKRTEMLTKQLDLTSDQQPKVLEIFKSEQSQMEKLHSDSSVAPEDRRSKMMDIHKSTNDQVRALLTSDQQKKWDEMQSRRGQWGHHGDMQKPGPPPDSSNPNQ